MLKNAVILVLFLGLAGSSFYFNMQIKDLKEDKIRLNNELATEIKVRKESLESVWSSLTVYKQRSKDLIDKNNELHQYIADQDQRLQYTNEILVEYEAFKDSVKAQQLSNAYYTIVSSTDRAVTIEIWFYPETETFKTELHREPIKFFVTLAWDDENERFVNYIEIEGDTTVQVTKMLPQYTDDIFKKINDLRWYDFLSIDATVGVKSKFLGMLGVGYSSVSLGVWTVDDQQGFYLSKRFYPFK